MADRNGRVKRLFIAIDLDERTRSEVAVIASALKTSVTSGSASSFVASGFSRARITWVHPSRLHLTLAFLSEADAALERRALAALAQPISMAPFDLAFGGIGCFPPKGLPRVLWLGITDGLAELRQLHELLEGRVGAGRGAGEAFHPHLTLARLRDGMSKPDVAKLAEMKASGGPCRIDRVTLYESRLSPEGPAYLALAKAELMPCT